MTDQQWAGIVLGMEGSRMRPHSWKFKSGPAREHFTPENPGVCRYCLQERYYGRRRTGGRSRLIVGTLSNPLKRPIAWASEIRCPAAAKEVGD